MRVPTHTSSQFAAKLPQVYARTRLNFPDGSDVQRFFAPWCVFIFPRHAVVENERLGRAHACAVASSRPKNMVMVGEKKAAGAGPGCRHALRVPHRVDRLCSSPSFLPAPIVSAMSDNPSTPLDDAERVCYIDWARRQVTKRRADPFEASREAAVGGVSVAWALVSAVERARDPASQAKAGPEAHTSSQREARRRAGADPSSTSDEGQDGPTAQSRAVGTKSCGGDLQGDLGCMYCTPVHYVYTDRGAEGSS